MTLVAVPIVDALQRDPSEAESVSLRLAPHASRGNAGLTLRRSTSDHPMGGVNRPACASHSRIPS